MSAMHEQIAGRLGDLGQRYTAKRRALVDALVRSGAPTPIGDLADPRRGLPQSSVYRNLSILEEAGVVHRLVTGEGFGRYELADDLTEHHHHVICRRCGRVDDVAVPARLERSIATSVASVAVSTGFADVSHRLDLIGTCGDCRAEAAEAPPERR